jgi:predicted metal-dependent hydrolase
MKVNEEICHFTYGKKSIHYRLLYASRKTLEIAVHPDGSVSVKAPINADIELIEVKLKKRARWILRQLNFFKQFNPRTPPRSYINGESHLYLGKQYRLKVEKAEQDSVRLSKGRFFVTSINMSPENIQYLLDSWYRQKAEIQFNQSLERCWQRFERFELEQPRVAIRVMQKRWGSLSEKGTMTLNIHLIRAPKECIDCVVTHELCHLIHKDHGKAFYQLLDAMLPEWEKLKHKLEVGLL